MKTLHSTSRPIVIIGGGPAGLGAAYMLDALGFDDWLLFEREQVVGGLSRSFRDPHGFTWDIGGHVAFSHYGLYSRLLGDLLGEDGWIEHQRESWIRLLGAWIPYPMQYNLHRLPPEQSAQCLQGLITAALNPRQGEFANFDDFILRTFGQGIAELFMRPYNLKVWAYPLPQLAAGWIAERVAVPDPVRVARNVALRRDDISWGPNNTFCFPRHGGTGAIWQALADRLPQSKLTTGREVVALDVDARTIRFADGRVQPYELLISTMPLDLLAQMSQRQHWIRQADDLVHSATHVIGVGLDGRAPEELATKCWMYFPEDNCPFYRATLFSHYSPNNVDDIRSHWSLMCEVSESPQKPVNLSAVVQDTIQGLVSTGMIRSADEVAHTWHMRVEHGYPTPTARRDQVLAELLPALYEKGILSRGRFGAWRYEVGNMDHSFMQGVEAAAHLLTGSPELTVWEPAVVNSRHPVLGWDRMFARHPLPTTYPYAPHRPLLHPGMPAARVA